ncbi:hypothetical protein TRFO_30811 [Tritrichomonas foetus]|uniref:Initiator binding domain-containing protein n=1 Tax=Tritrichomonas foetus TaxID=1144522 RepID=A0A1J4JSY9_9EUKA|nr:hypothetical protein TRFO_30811 [Tritrichomonas foetus]|eukprot:OHT02187.1 hypothetical protein TRFO_30811 [Tritrichomonas foetus]
MNNEFNFNSDNDDSFWKLNSPSSDQFDTYKFDFSSQPMDSFLEPDFSLDNNSPNFAEEIELSTIASPPTASNNSPIMSNFDQTAPIPPQFPSTNFHSNISNFNNMNPSMNGMNGMFGMNGMNMMNGIGNMGSINQMNINHQPNIPNMNNVTINPNVHMQKSNTQDALPTSTHRRTPSTPSSFAFPFNMMALQAIQQQQQAHELPLVQSRNRKMNSQPLPSIQDLTSSADSEFLSVCKDPDIKFNPHKLGFIPQKFWPDRDYTFGELVTDFFQRKNNANSRFYHKLYNALKISENDPFYAEYLGIEWITEKVLKVDKKKFARLLGIKTIDGSLFHQQGNFPSHGFFELGTNDALSYVSQSDLEDVDYENVRLLVHQAGVFVRGCTEDAIEGCRWVSSRKRH